MTSSRTTSRGWSLGILLGAPFLAQADTTIANVATPSIGRGLGASGATLELVISGYLVAFAALLTTGARLGQTHGYRRMFLGGLSVFGIASLVCEHDFSQIGGALGVAGFGTLCLSQSAGAAPAHAFGVVAAAFAGAALLASATAWLSTHSPVRRVTAPAAPTQSRVAPSAN